MHAWSGSDPCLAEWPLYLYGVVKYSGIWHVDIFRVCRRRQTVDGKQKISFITTPLWTYRERRVFLKSGLEAKWVGMFRWIFQDRRSLRRVARDPKKGLWRMGVATGVEPWMNQALGDFAQAPTTVDVSDSAWTPILWPLKYSTYEGSDVSMFQINLGNAEMLLFLNNKNHSQSLWKGKKKVQCSPTCFQSCNIKRMVSVLKADILSRYCIIWMADIQLWKTWWPMHPFLSFPKILKNFEWGTEGFNLRGHCRLNPPVPHSKLSFSTF